MEPIIRSDLMYLSKDQVSAVRKLMKEAWLKLDTTFYYGRWEALLNIDAEEDAHKALLLRLDPPGYEDLRDNIEDNNNIVDEHAAQSRTAAILPTKLPDKTTIQEVGTAMAGEAEDASYVDLFMDDVAREDQEAEYENHDDDDASQATDMSFDQWEQRNAEALNSDEFGFGLEDDRDIDQLFDESGLQP
eukprot:556710-Amphidinium_carterae.1